MIHIDLFDRCRSRNQREHLLSVRVEVNGQLVIGRLVRLLVLQPGDGAVLVHGGGR